LNINKKGDYNVTHCHGGSDLSFVWYLTDAGTQEGRGEGRLIFRDPNAFGNSKFHRYLEFKGDTIRWEMKAGDLLAFPSYLEHGVEPHTSEEDRISIAGNCAC
jgi:predicted 2-oxoglutarate/Fe(II)-dependent dioxygenase YbiX